MEVDALLKYMQDLPVVKVVIQTTTSAFLMECRIVSIAPSYFEIELLPHQAGFSNIDFADSCVISCEKGGQVFYLDARIDLILSETCLRLVALKVDARSQQRGYFRVDATIYLKFWLVEKAQEGHPNIVHQRINLSGNGLRFTTAKPLQVGQLIPLELGLPDSEAEVVQGVGRVVRVDDKGTDLQEAALELVELEEDEQDKIISFCLAEQRKQLRMRVHVV